MSQIRVTHVEPVAQAGSLIALFTVEIENVATVERCRYIASPRGVFVTGPSFRDQYARGGWAQPVTFDAEVSAELLQIVQARMLQDRDQAA